MKIDKKLIKELVDNLKEFNLSELEYQDGETRIKVSKIQKKVGYDATTTLDRVPSQRWRNIGRSSRVV